MIKIKIWLSICCLLVSLMVWVGGITRLTGSGLSITEWQPISGIMPPLNNESWINVYEKYAATSEYKIINYDMTLSQFKKIYWTEYVHRLLARVTGIFFIVPFIYFALTKKLGLKIIIINTLISILMASQALVGWYVVQSGLRDSHQVSHYWLAFHLGMAFVIFSLLFCQIISNDNVSDINVYQKNKLSVAISILIFLQIILGALLAGLHGGLIYNSFPLMEGSIIPQDVLQDALKFNPLKNIGLIQFLHRWVAIIITIMTFILMSKNFRTKTLILFLMAILQTTLGITTLIMKAHIIPASIHQVVALILFGTSLYTKN